ncbi:MAG: aminoglycoside phosphotransferase family protein [candidate division KSB1 bacterium]|nr:aminoglycoside phosphotransferase family protein [candidate division KSB1 bacterium]
MNMPVAANNSKHQFAPALDAQWLKENLPRYLWHESEAPGKIEEIEIWHVRESKKSVAVLYRLALNGDGKLREQLYVGHVVPADKLQEEYKSALKKAKIPPAVGRTVALVPESNLILLAYPNDRKMRLLSEDALKPWLQAHLHEIAGDALAGHNWQVQSAQVEMLRYIPDKRFTARCKATLKTASGVEKEIGFIAKQINDVKRAKRLYRHLLSLRQAWGTAAGPPMRLPRALAFDENMAVVYIEYLPGENLKQLLFELDLAQVMPAVGELLANFHRAQQRVRKQVTRRNELAEVREAMHNLGKAFPALRPRLRQLYQPFKDFYWPDATPPVLLHGTYRLNHIFIHDGELALFDLDSLRMGHPAYDVANFLSSLYYLEAQERVTPALRQEIAGHFLHGYATQAAWKIPPAAVLWFLTSLLIHKQANKYVTHYHQDGAQKVQQMLALAEAAFAACRQAPNDLTGDAVWKVLP